MRTEAFVPYKQPDVRAVLLGLPRCDEITARTATLHDEVLERVEDRGIVVYWSLFRTKTQESLKNKVIRFKRQGTNMPIADVHGLHFVIEEEDIHPTIEVVKQTQTVPEKIGWLDTVRCGNNSIGTSDYYSTRVYFLFDRTRWAELKLETPEQYESNLRAREAYLERRGYR